VDGGEPGAVSGAVSGGKKLKIMGEIWDDSPAMAFAVLVKKLLAAILAE
jgi:hypothetical protein